jgi:hypothetical protein
MALGARYLIRFDDICPTMNWATWDRIEAVLSELDIRPLVAVVPDNRDAHLVVDSPRPDFWNRVRHWQSLGWCIALHGFEHKYETAHAGLIGINPYSEFAGLPAATQRAKLEAGLRVFADNGVRADAWSAPGHSFDATTVSVLVDLGIKVISDGYFWRPVRFMGATWLPQQMWRLRPMPAGLWTVCFHSNALHPRDIGSVEGPLRVFRPKVVSVQEVLEGPEIPEITPLDRMISTGWQYAVKTKRLLRR